jgi:hypothetical protein
LPTPESAALICYLSARLQGSWQAGERLLRLGSNSDDPACRTCRLDFLNGQDVSNISRSIQDERCGAATVLAAATALSLERIGGFDCVHGAPRLTEPQTNYQTVVNQRILRRLNVLSHVGRRHTKFTAYRMASRSSPCTGTVSTGGPRSAWRMARPLRLRTSRALYSAPDVCGS